MGRLGQNCHFFTKGNFTLIDLFLLPVSQIVAETRLFNPFLKLEDPGRNTFSLLDSQSNTIGVVGS